MRRFWMFLLIALLATGCAVPGEAAPAAPAAEEENMRAALVESAPLPLPEEEILDAYERALRVYGWFELSPLPSTEESASFGGKTYRRVNMDGIRKLEDLRAYLRSFFSQDLTAELLDGESARIQYRDIGGLLYVSGERRDRDPGKGKIQIDTEALDETTYSVNVVVELLDESGKTVVGLESWSFPYAYDEDRWVFTDVQLVY